ncbi:MAG: hypothetical protein IH898_12875 [Planctomycetes bacterium]|nr:hypothetical protein [Planctomycetota bacterium]
MTNLRGYFSVPRGRGRWIPPRQGRAVLRRGSIVCGRIRLVDPHRFGFNIGRSGKSQPKIDEFIPHIDEMVQEGMAILERVEVLKYRASS